jgi:hypothetical protein
MHKDQKNAEVARLNQRITDYELRIKEEVNKGSFVLSQSSKYTEEIILLKSKNQSLEKA